MIISNINKRKNINSVGSKSFFWLFAIVSFWLFGPHQSYFFGSDQAIHLLMALDFKLPEDAYYWGQDRLGSFLPMICYPLVKAIPLHPIIILGIVQYSILMILFFVIQSRIDLLAGQILVFVALFFPHPTYYFLLLIGHPYASQMLFLCLALLCFEKIFNNSISTEAKVWLFWPLFHFCAFLAIWINDLSIMIYFGCSFWILIRLKSFKSKELRTALISLLYPVLFLLILLYFKINATRDSSYGKLFIFNLKEIAEQWGHLWIQIKNIIWLRNHHSIAEAIFYYFIVFALLKIFLVKRKWDFILVMLVVTSILLFFSFWNYRSHFEAKYYIPIYVLGISWIGYNLKILNNWFRWIITIGISLSIIWSNLDFVLITRDSKLAIEKDRDIEWLPKSNYLGDYWDVYLISAISRGRISGISMNSWDCRNLHKREKWNKNNNWFVSTKFFRANHLEHFDTINIYNQIIVSQNKKYAIVDNDTCFWYSKLAQ